MSIEYFSGVFVYAVLLAVFAVGIAFWLSTADNLLPLRKRATIAALSGSGILTAVPLVIIVMEGGFSSELLIIGLVLIVAGLFFAAVIGFPAAYVAGRRFDDRRNRKTVDP